MKNNAKKGSLLRLRAIAFILMVLPLTLMAQNINVSGTVIDNLGEPVIGASVMVKGTANGTITNLDGQFNLSNVKQGATIVVSFIGYVTQEVKADSQLLKVELKEDSQTLQEVVVTGYGGVQKAKTMTASAATVRVDELAKLPVTSMSEGLGGRVTGVITQQGSGAPGENAKIWIRGGSNILYVIDDVVLETKQGEDFFNRLRPDDIASMSILKDAAATAVYGPRAKDGVVVIATKRGQDGAPTITFNQKVSIMTPSYRAKGMSSYDFAKARNEVEFANFQESPTFNNEALSKYYMGDLWQKGYNQADIMNMVNQEYGTSYSSQDIADLFDPFKTQKGNIQDYFSSYDPWEMFDHVQPMYQTNLSIRGGGDRVKYYSSLGYLKQKGLSSSFDYEQINIILNTDAYLLKDKSLKFTFNLNGNTNTKKKPNRGEAVFTDAMYGDWMPKNPSEWSTGLPRKKSVNSLLKTGFNDVEAYRFQMNTALKWNLPWVEGLSAMGSVNFTTTYNMNKSFKYDEEDVYDTPYSTVVSAFNPQNAELYQYWYNYKLLTGTFQIDYARSFGKHNLAGMVNYQSQTRHTNESWGRGKGFGSTLAPQLNMASEIVTGRDGDGNPYTGGNAGEWGTMGFVGRVSYDYANKYLFQYSANYNASLSYSPGKRWGYFQAVSAGWVLSEESWFKNFISPKVLNMFKIRAGYGLVGKEVGDPFSYLTQYGQNGTRVLFGDGMIANTAWYENTVASDLSWSSSKQLNAGIDFGLLNDRLTGSIDTYLYMNSGEEMDMTADMIRTDILGMPNIPKINAPYVTSKKGGFEISLNWQDKIGQVSYRIGGNYSYWDERVVRHTDVDNEYYYIGRDNIGLRAMHPVYQAGYITNGLYGSWNQMYNSMLHSTRNQNLGTFVVQDMNGDGVIGVGDQYVLNTPGTTPLTQYGFTLGANWKGLDIELFFQGAANVSGAMPSPLRSQQSYMWNYGQYAFQNSYLPSNGNTDAALPLPVSEGNGWGYNSVDVWAFDASYLKLKNISVRYDLKRNLLKRVSVIQGCDVSFVVTNAFTWTKDSYPLKGLQDPEFITSGASIYNNNGTLGSYPTQRSYTFGVTVTL